MPIRTIVDNTFYLFDSAGTALASTVWPAGARISQIRILALTTAASVTFQIAAGTPWFEWSYTQVGFAGVGSTVSVVPTLYTIPMGGIRVPTAIIPTTLTAATAWIDFV